MTSSTEIQPTPIFVGTMAFCPHCGNLMDPPSKNPVSTCGSCGYAYKLEDNSVRVISKSQPSAFQSSLKSKRELVQRQSLAREEAATVIPNLCCISHV
ncbi:DNA-directed RNA polymerase I core subunit rpa12, variant 3 [Entomophthora muscae]|uniref:DNA-directed RNA polymerase I core subunit rpa12, variant 3 n=1 Tax=Entomophthora muscae TaxID=34485 RepID=A0ACC2TRA5_9FUNG|nr:DNA-directed RNA polymerase I core subunit rpa12, variant 3 [Entomophthora muscae]